jgi:putative membrane protein
MPMTPRLLIILGCAVLAAAWLGPLPRMVPDSFAAHMTLHMTVVGIGVPLIGIGLASLASKVLALRDARFIPIFASVLDLIVVWGWHMPALHHASRSEPWALAAEQASFGAVTLLVWLTAFAGPALVGAVALFFTSMHMTLLGALLGLSTRPLYPGHHHDALGGLSALQDQQLGAAVMLTVGAAVYLGGALTLVARVLRRATP